jgi:hypothetical protein
MIYTHSHKRMSMSFWSYLFISFISARRTYTVIMVSQNIVLLYLLLIAFKFPKVPHSKVHLRKSQYNYYYYVQTCALHVVICSVELYNKTDYIYMSVVFDWCGGQPWSTAFEEKGKTTINVLLLKKYFHIYPMLVYSRSIHCHVPSVQLSWYWIEWRMF